MLAIFLFTAIFTVIRTGMTLDKVTGGNILQGIVKSIPGVSGTNKLKAEENGRINVALLGMRGEELPGGGLLADTIMVISALPEENLFSVISVPRDLYVNLPGLSDKQKINAVHYYGEQKGEGQGLEDMKTVLSEVTGMPIHYAARINFKGFEELVDAIGGVDVHLDEPFIEPVQFHKEHVCDDTVFTVPSGNFEEKLSLNPDGTVRKVKARYPLCYNSDEECGGIFELPAGDITLSGEQALCYVRARETSTDFDRARRQQEVLKVIKDELLSTGTFTDINKLNSLLDVLGNNVRTDMELWEIKLGLELAQATQNPTIIQKVLDTSEEGLLYAPEVPEGGAYILLPRGDSYDQIHNLFGTVFDEELQKQAESQPAQ